MTEFIAGYQGVIYGFAEIVICTLELIGMLIILIGTFKSLFLLLRRIHKLKRFNVIVDLGRSLALALECKMGAEIIRTVIINDLEELGILTVVILVRGLLAFLLHWEVRMEQKTAREREALQAEETKQAKASEQTEQK